MTKQLKKKKYSDWKWIMTITALAFVISFLFSFISELTLPNANLVVGIILVILFILLGILFDIIGVAVATADEKPFHSMAARKIKGARTAVSLKKNASKVSSFCNDVIGDICGIISGSAGVTIATSIADTFHVSLMLVTLVITALIAAMTIGGKAAGKGFAMAKSNDILCVFAKLSPDLYISKSYILPLMLWE